MWSVVIFMHFVHEFTYVYLAHISNVVAMVFIPEKVVSVPNEAIQTHVHLAYTMHQQ